MPVRPFRDGERRIGGKPRAPALPQLFCAIEVEEVIQGASAELRLHLRKLGEMGADMGFERLLHRMRLDTELDRH